MRTILKRALAALSPVIDYGRTDIYRIDSAGSHSEAHGLCPYVEVQWLGLHLSFQAGRLPALPEPAEVQESIDRETAFMARKIVAARALSAWRLAHQSYLDKRAHFEAMPIGTPEENVALDAWVAAMNHLIENAPAPDGEALAIKIELAATREIEMYPEWIAAFAADARRLCPEGR